ncbi:MAG: DNA-deoxyinosine glycosylase [Alphaproteobacteria bacterium]|nr:DNA-deoxyinosine glycosylase [Alphaproteobacteria bacterium]
MESHPKIRSFAPITGKNSRILILGSMPGVASLEAGQYYAHPRNVFWRIMAELLNMPENLSYPQKTQHLCSTGIALWDVLHTCVRPGSLDSAISDEVPNDFAAFFKTHPHISALFFNGQKARRAFKKHVAPSLDINTLPLYTLPSTSPANASWSFERKLESWQSIMNYL